MLDITSAIKIIYIIEVDVYKMFKHLDDSNG